MYNYLLYLDPEIKKSLAVLLEELKDHFADKMSAPNELLLDDEKIMLRYNHYRFYIHENQDDTIREELQELHDHAAGKDFAGNATDLQKFSDSVKRFELHGEQDFDMNYFNESLFIIGFFEKAHHYLIFETY